MTDIQNKAWLLYCEETAGDMDTVNFWHQLSSTVQNIYLNKVRGDTMKGKKGRKVYIAASYTNIVAAKKLGQELADMDFEVLSRWHIEGNSPVDSDYQSPSRAMRDYQQVQECDLFIELIGDDGSKGGRHCELGIAIGFNKKIMLVGGPDNCIFTNLPWLARFRSTEDLIAKLKG